MFSGKRTIYNLQLQNRMLCNLPYITQLNTTLNEHLNILNYIKDETIKYPSINLITIGCGELNSSDSVLKHNTTKHRVTNIKLMEHIPFYMRKIDEVELYPPSMRLRLKKEIVIDDITYLAYFGYKVENYDYSDSIIKYDEIEAKNVQIEELDLTKSLREETTDNTDLTNMEKNNYISDFVKIYTFFSKEELLEISNAMDILYPSKSKVITEVGICTSKEYELEGYTENIETQIAFFIDTEEDIEKNILNNKLDFTFEIGGMEMLIID